MSRPAIGARRASAAERRLLPEGRLTGPTPWVIAVMAFLAGLILVAGLALGGAARGLGEGASRRLTVQIVTADPVGRDAQAVAAAVLLRRSPGVTEVRPVPPAEIDRLLAPWLGPHAGAALPLPAMIDVTLAAGAAPPAATALARVAPAARIERHEAALAPLGGLIASLRLLGWALLALMAGTMAAVTMLAARAALIQHRPTVDILHLLGATDAQVARLFARRLALDALLGAGLGVAAAGLVLVALGWKLAALDGGLTAPALPGALVLSLLPPLAAMLAWGAARATVALRLRAAA